MNRKKFLKISSSLLAAGLLQPLSACKNQFKISRRNWGGNYIYKARELHTPESVEELQLLVKRSAHQKVLGSRHCFNGIADSQHSQISLRRLNKVLSIDPSAMMVTVEGGIRYEELAPELDKNGYALHNLASLPQITVAGACATATHGSGIANKNLSTAVSGLEFISGDGEIFRLRRDEDGEKFNGAVVNLGALGVVTRLTLDMEKTFNVRQDVFQNLPLKMLFDNFTAIMQSGYSVSLFTDWQNDVISQVWIKRRTDQAIIDYKNDFYGALASTKNLHPVTRFSSQPCTEQLGAHGPWYDRLPHFKIGALPLDGNELQSEYFIPLENAVEAIAALTKKGDIIFPHLLISELRTVAADKLWLSPACNTPCLGIHFTWKPDWQSVRKILPLIEAELSPFNVRPHWGKTFTMDPGIVRSRYERMDDFAKLVKEYDPANKFRNDYLDNYIL